MNELYDCPVCERYNYPELMFAHADTFYCSKDCVIESLQQQLAESEEAKRELLEALLIARQQITKACTEDLDADELLNVTDPVLAKHTFAA